MNDPRRERILTGGFRPERMDVGHIAIRAQKLSRIGRDLGACQEAGVKESVLAVAVGGCPAEGRQGSLVPPQVWEIQGSEWAGEMVVGWNGCRP